MTPWRYWYGRFRFVLQFGADDGYLWAWRTWANIIRDDDWARHEGDCTSVAQTCMRCLVTHYAGLPYDGPPPRGSR